MEFFLFIKLKKKKRKSIKLTENSSFFSLNAGFIFILWYENYHISLVAIAVREI
jgi:hypothetical protein